MAEASMFAGRLKELRESAGLTQKQLADKAGLGLRAVTYLESGDRKPAWETVLSLASALGVECTAFTQEPTATDPRPKGRPRKPDTTAESIPPASAEAEKPVKGKGKGKPSGEKKGKPRGKKGGGKA